MFHSSAPQFTSSGTIYAALTAILRARRAAGAGPVTLLNCDNLRHNGERFRSGLLQFLDLVGDTGLRAWVEVHTTSPNAMVDRITPRPAPEVRERVKAATGIDDPAALMGESFIQWVIEDDFIAGRPAWERVGVEMVKSVQPYEEAKIRLLNATHSCIAWAGTLVGYLYIHEGTHHPRRIDPAVAVKMAIFDRQYCPLQIGRNSIQRNHFSVGFSMHTGQQFTVDIVDMGGFGGNVVTKDPYIG